MNELKACPFCGSEVKLQDTGNWYTQFIRCKGCDAQMQRYKGEGVIIPWNTRPIEDALQARIDELEEMFNGTQTGQALRILTELQKSFQALGLHNPEVKHD